MLAVIQRLSTEWIVSFTFRLTSATQSSTYCNLIHLTDGGSYAEYGGRTPAVLLKGAPTITNFVFSSSINGLPSEIKFEAPVSEVNVPTHIEVHQRYTSGGNYRYFIKINGEEIGSIINTDARQFYNVKVYASHSSKPICPGHIKNFLVTNFL